MIKKFDQKIVDQDNKLEGKYKLIEQAKEHCNEQYKQMRKDRTENIKQFERMDEDLERMRDHIAMSKIKMEADLTLFKQKQDAMKAEADQQLKDVGQKMDLLKVGQENISNQFVTFGEQIEISKYKLEEIIPVVYKIKSTKADGKVVAEKFELLENTVM